MPEPKPDYPNMYSHTGGKPMDITSEATKKGQAREKAAGETSRSWQSFGQSSSRDSASDNAITGRGLY